MDISVTTGLPELPEGFWWKVERSQVREHSYSYMWYMTEAVRVHIMRKKITTTARFLRTNKVTEEHIKVLSSVVERELTPARFNESTGEMIRATYDRDVTPENILHTAKTLVGRYWAMKEQEKVDDERRRVEAEERARVDALLGNYPPKKLEVGK